MTMSQKAGMQGRDYLVPKPTPDLSGFRRALVKYQDAVTMSRALLMALRADVTLAGKDGPEPGGLLLNQVSFSGVNTRKEVLYMARSGLKSARWWAAGPFSQEEEYLRNLEASIKVAQSEVANMLRQWEPCLKSWKIRSSPT